MKNLAYALALLPIFMGKNSFAHGEDKPGPHGGFIRMPGAFHTEVLLDGPHKVKVYLLDLHWKNPTVRDSKVTATFTGGKKFEADCEKKADAFVCAFDRNVDLTSPGELSIQATRQKQAGVAAEYKTPLSLPGSAGSHAH